MSVRPRHVCFDDDGLAHVVSQARLERLMNRDEREKAERIIEEAPAAYKPITPVVDIQVQAGVVGRVARLRPRLTFKT